MIDSIDANQEIEARCSEHLSSKKESYDFKEGVNNEEFIEEKKKIVKVIKSRGPLDLMELAKFTQNSQKKTNTLINSLLHGRIVERFGTKFQLITQKLSQESIMEFIIREGSSTITAISGTFNTSRQSALNITRKLEARGLIRVETTKSKHLNRDVKENIYPINQQPTATGANHDLNLITNQISGIEKDVNQLRNLFEELITSQDEIITRILNKFRSEAKNKKEE